MASILRKVNLVMKNAFRQILLGLGFISWLNLAHAQQTDAIGSFNNNLGPVQSATSDSVVSIAADLAGLTQVDPVDVPKFGTFWWVMPGGNALPAPCAPQDGSGVIYQVADGQYLVDETGGQITPMNTRRLSQAQATSTTVASAAAAETQAVLDLIAQIQTTVASRQERAMARAMGMDLPSPGDGGDDGGYYTSSAGTYSLPTNGLFLTIEGVANGQVNATLHGGTNFVYAIEGTSDLTLSWNVETELFPTDTNAFPFTVPTLNRDMLFLRAKDWTGITSFGNTVPEWWFWKYFGTVDLAETPDLDTQGNTLLSDYQNTNDPNVISFTVRLGNQQFNVTNATGSYLVLAGVPSYESVLVNDTNFNDAVWQPYDGTVYMNLGPTDGVYQVQVGLKGRAADSQSTWIGTQVTLSRSVPQITLTSPITNVVAQPWLQMQGYATRPLATVTYDINGVTNLQASIIGRTLDTNLSAYTTNYFQCYDIPLSTNAPNVVTLHATDPAGNTTNIILNLWLDYSTATNPVIQLTWPQAGRRFAAAVSRCAAGQKMPPPRYRPKSPTRAGIQMC